jgi:murein DD-endopeptidase MepM/ murein hydrolase activator NlpD
MDDTIFSQLLSIQNTNSSALAGQQNANQSGSTTDSFQNLLTTLLLATTLSSSTSNFNSQNSSSSPLLSAFSSLGNSSSMTSQIVMSLLSLLLKQTSPDTLQPAKVSAPKNSPSGKPVQGVVTQNYHPGHIGIDFGVPIGTNVKSTIDGKVVSAGWNNQGYGNLVIVENGPYKTYYAHLSKIPVTVGEVVKAGDVIGISGSTGNSTGPHVHYEVRKDNTPIDPTSFTLK